jgi:hypothetical protein
MGVWSPIGGTRGRLKSFVPYAKSVPVGDQTPAASIAQTKADIVAERKPMPEKPDAKMMIYLEEGGIFRFEIFDPRGKRVVFYNPSSPNILLPRPEQILPQTMQIIEEHKNMKGGK